ncbi:MAG: hypothetical protein EP315_05305 [Gammaproteobacteria bacterium]|nr:MAG: hypothetical protein EP315_05305 [Gammaproteobacteria bacterium]
MDFRCYSQRLLNPFRGVMNIIEFEAAEAVTLDGVHWDIYVRDAELVKDLPNSHKVQTSDIRYGRWSASSGLKRGAIYPSEDFKVLEAQGALVYEYLLKHHQQIPFPFADVYELWLLDQFAQPLVLLKSAVLEDDLELDRLPDWCACHEAGDRFTTGISQQLTNHENLSAADYLGAYIKQLAGHTLTAQWFKRDVDGSGIACGDFQVEPVLSHRRLTADAFPDLLINEISHDDMHNTLIQDFIGWQAPCLLLLQHLSQPQRRQLEISARARASEVEKQHRLYPEIVDISQINAARVEARLRRSSGINKPAEDDVMSPEYIELMHPCPSE